MWTFLAGVAVVLAVAGIVFFLYRFPVVGRLAAWLATAFFLPVVLLCRLASATVDLFMSPQGARRRIAWWKRALWLTAGLLPMVFFFGDLAWPLPLPAAIDTGSFLIAGALVQVFVLGAAFFIVYEDFDVMDGVVAGKSRRIRGSRTATRPAVLAISVGLFAAYAIAIVYWLAEVEGLVLFDKRPHTGFALLDYVLIGLRTLPTDLFFGLLDRLTGDDTGVAFNATLAAQGYYIIVKTVGSSLLVGLVSIVIQEQWQLRRIVTEIGESDERHAYLVQRASFAPPVIKSGILRAAVSRSAIEKQKRLIVAAKEIGIFTLPQTFCHYLESFDPEVQQFGLDQCLEMFRFRSKEFEREQCEATLRKTARVLRRGKLKVEPLKKMLRLMTSMVIVKKDAIEIPDGLRGMIFASLKKELDKPRAREDAALRGFLRDLQSALGGSSTINKVAALDPRDDGWVKRLAERTLQIDGPSVLPVAKSYGGANGETNGHAQGAANGGTHSAANGNTRPDTNGAAPDLEVTRLAPPRDQDVQPGSPAPSEPR